jgi:hypothetical protein
MTVLRERVSWAKPRAATERRTSSDLTPEEQANVKTAIRFLAKRCGTYAKLAEAMGAKTATVQLAGSKRGAVSAGVALRVARAAGVPLEAVLAGRWPVAGSCPHCGRI